MFYPLGFQGLMQEQTYLNLIIHLRNRKEVHCQSLTLLRLRSFHYRLISVPGESTSGWCL